MFIQYNKKFYNYSGCIGWFTHEMYDISFDENMEPFASLAYARILIFPGSQESQISQFSHA